MLNTSYTLNVGSPAADVVFDLSAKNGNRAIYYSPSPEGDLAGRPSLRYENETTKAGIARTLVSFKKPRLNPTTGKYDTATTGNFTLNRPETSPLQDAKDVQEMMREFLAASGVADAIAEAEGPQ